MTLQADQNIGGRAWLLLDEREAIAIEMALALLAEREDYQPWAEVARRLRPRVSDHMREHWPANFFPRGVRCDRAALDEERKP